MRRTWERFTCATVCVTAAGLGGCSGPLSTLDTAGPVASSIASLWWVMLAGAAAIFALVMVLLAWAFLRPAAGRDVPMGWWLVGGGLVLPAAVLTPLLAFALWSGERLVPFGGAAVTQVDVLARQWEWVFTYRDADGGPARSSNVLHVEAGRPVQINVTSADVIHSFWVPRLAGKIDAIPGHTNVLRLQADAPGFYRGLCAEFCGIAHLEMQFAVQAHAAEDYRATLGRLPRASSDGAIREDVRERN